MPEKIFVAIPNMGTVTHHILNRMAQWSMDGKYQIQIAALSNHFFHDYARNKLCEGFLKSPCEWLLFLDSDVEPHPELLRMTDYRKDICAANVMAWRGEMFSSIWKKASCEECKALGVFKETGQNKDPREYWIEGEILFRWNPYYQQWTPFYDRESMTHLGGKCRCAGTGLDPYVYQADTRVREKESPIKVDAVGAAALLIHRRVIETIEPPWFQFLYRHNREVMLTEDLAFCHKARIFGFEIWADQNLLCGHYKTINLLSVSEWAWKVFEMGQEVAKKPERNLIIVPGR